ncbi:cation-binding protein [Dietzia natronolimnaea]|uniref:Cation-binding protein n=1 Tax=Dietzia natronolimnaea TaxID=161920 RepID=A0A2A2WMA1_9ACTN|nr:hemerythrin domain-containing protein [Dietzia natronolimnaea]PAY22320.1 cation-binding protein [Dietzia natronolimnaea]
MRSLSEQSLRELGGRSSVLTRQKLDHIELDRLLGRLELSRGAEQRRVLLRTYRLVFPHAFAEESVLWPAIRKALPDGHALTLRVEQEHQEVNELVVRLETLESEGPERDEVLRRLVAVLREDVRDEEHVLLPRLQAALPPSRLRALGLAWEVVRRTAPTRPHPVVARRPPGNVIAAFPVTITDRVRDLLDLAATASPTRTRSGLTTASTMVAHAAHALERLPVMRRGEHPSTARGDDAERAE